VERLVVTIDAVLLFDASTVQWRWQSPGVGLLADRRVEHGEKDGERGHE